MRHIIYVLSVVSLLSACIGIGVVWEASQRYMSVCLASCCCCSLLFIIIIFFVELLLLQLLIAYTWWHLKWYSILLYMSHCLMLMLYVFCQVKKMDDTKKRKKSYYHQVKRQCGGRKMLDAGMKGFLITCSGKEKQTVHEAYNLLNEYANVLYGEVC